MHVTYKKIKEKDNENFLGYEEIILILPPFVKEIKTIGEDRHFVYLFDFQYSAILDGRVSTIAEEDWEEYSDCYERVTP